MTQSCTSLRIASFAVKMAGNFLLNILFSVSVKHISSAALIKLPDVVSVLEDVFVAGVDVVVSEKVTRAFVGVYLDLNAFVFGILLSSFTELFVLNDLIELLKVE